MPKILPLALNLHRGRSRFIMCPAAGVRVDSAIYQGYSVPPYYDSLIGKLIVGY